MPSKNSKPTQTLQASYAQRFGDLISLAARRGYSQRALEGLLLAAITAHAANWTRRKGMRRHA